MTDHLTNSQMKRFCVRALPLDEMTAAAEHLGKCPKCDDRFTETLQRRRGDAKLSFTLTPEFAFRHEHVDYEQLVALADDMLDSIEREILDIHLSVCGFCREDVRDFLEFRREQTLW